MRRAPFKTIRPTTVPVTMALGDQARQAGVADYRLEETRPHVIAGSPEHVREQLDALSARYGIEEFVIDTPVTGFAELLASVELLASAYATAEA